MNSLYCDSSSGHSVCSLFYVISSTPLALICTCICEDDAGRTKQYKVTTIQCLCLGICVYCERVGVCVR